MNVGIAIGSLGLLGLLGCASGSASVNGADPAAIRNAPAGVALMTFIDLETLRPDQLMAGSGASLPPGITFSGTGGTGTYTFATKAANEGSMTGTVTVTGPVTGTSGQVTYTEVFNLTVTSPIPGGATQTWTYSGSQLVTLDGTKATVSLAGPAPIRAALVDSATPANNKSYGFSPDLKVDLTDPASVALSGGYGLAGSNGDTITCSIGSGNPILWTPACQYPSGGKLTLGLVSQIGNDKADAAFDRGCGNINVNGVTLGLGGN